VVAVGTAGFIVAVGAGSGVAVGVAPQAPASRAKIMKTATRRYMTRVLHMLLIS